MITLDNIENIQKEWGDSLVKTRQFKNNRDACEKEAESLLINFMDIKTAQFFLNLQKQKTINLG